MVRFGAAAGDPGPVWPRWPSCGPVAAGLEVLHEGEQSDEFGVLLSGRIALRMLVPERGSVTILTVEPDDIFGWSAIVPPYRASSTVISIEPFEALMFEGPALRAALRADDALAATLYPRVLQAVSPTARRHPPPAPRPLLPERQRRVDRGGERWS